MAIHIRITDRVVGESQIYAKEGKRGSVISVPTYALEIGDDSGVHCEMEVARDTWRSMHNPSVFYGTNGECPPHRDGEPYRGYVLMHGSKGFRLGIYEPQLYEQGYRHALQGKGDAIRKYIQIHIGPGKSDGCFLLCDDHRGREAFAGTLQRMLQKQGTETPIIVEVWDRHVGVV